MPGDPAGHADRRVMGEPAHPQQTHDRKLVGRALYAPRALTLCRHGIRAFLLDEAVSLLTLTGLGGVGKTSLALAVVRDMTAQFADSAVFTDLSPLAPVSWCRPAKHSRYAIRGWLRLRPCAE
jgi:hypothetical protein